MKSKSHKRRRPGDGMVVPLAIAGALVLLLAAVLVMSQRGAGPRGEVIVAERTTYNFGNVSMGAGLMKTRFPLAVQRAAVVTGLSTT